jgi:voltage-gated potassium channel
VTGWKRVLRLIVLIGLALAVYFVVPVVLDDEDLALRLVFGVLCLLVLAASVIWQVVLHVEDKDRTVDGLLVALVVAVLVFALAFYRLATANPGQVVGLETRIDALYFTMTMLLTVGFGDIHAEGQAARVLVLIAMVFNVVVIATAVTTLSSRVRQQAELRAEARRTAQEAGEPQRRRKPR